MYISVIVPFLNEEKYIEQCIQSLLSQDYDKSKYEIIFIDNGSSDSSVEIVRKYPEVQLLYEAKRCPYAARNKGLQLAIGEIIAFTDADCIVSKDWLSQIYNGMIANKADIALGKRLFGSDSFIAKIFEDYENNKISYLVERNMRNYYYGYTNNMAIKKYLFEKHGQFLVANTYAVAGDTNFLQRCLKNEHGLRVVYLPDMTIKHLEINSTLDWLAKEYLYGMINIYINKSTHCESNIPITCKVGIYFQMVRDNKYAFIKKLLGVIVLFIGYMFYLAGNIKAHLSFVKS